MKKILLLFAGLLLAVGTEAYTCVSFKSGDPSILMKKCRISYEVVWDRARVTNYDNLLFPDYLKKRGDDFVRDWPSDRKKIEKYFTKQFNRKSDFMKIADGGKTDYKMILRLTSIDIGNGASGFNPWASRKAGGVIINGTIDFVDNSTGKVVCVLNIIKAKGTSSPSETVRMGLTFVVIGGDIHDFIDDDVKDGKVRATKVDRKASAELEADSKAEKKADSKADRKREREKEREADDDDDDDREEPKLVVTERRDYPASFNMKIGGQQFRMILVKGGRMRMGYDGRGSRRMRSEPVHRVAVTSFYISAEPVPATSVLTVLDEEKLKEEGGHHAQVNKYEDAERFAAVIAKRFKKPYRLPTEAEWEYAACSQQQKEIFGIAEGRDVAFEWCSDFYDEYPEDNGIVTDPKGPEKGRKHVVRAYNAERGKFNRNIDMDDDDDDYQGLVRLVIKAKDYMKYK